MKPTELRRRGFLEDIESQISTARAKDTVDSPADFARQTLSKLAVTPRDVLDIASMGAIMSNPRDVKYWELVNSIGQGVKDVVSNPKKILDNPPSISTVGSMVAPEAGLMGVRNSLYLKGRAYLHHLLTPNTPIRYISRSERQKMLAEAHRELELLRNEKVVGQLTSKDTLKEIIRHKKSLENLRHDLKSPYVKPDEKLMIKDEIRYLKNAINTLSDSYKRDLGRIVPPAERNVRQEYRNLYGKEAPGIYTKESLTDYTSDALGKHFVEFDVNPDKSKRNFKKMAPDEQSSFMNRIMFGDYEPSISLEDAPFQPKAIKDLYYFPKGVNSFAEETSPKDFIKATINNIKREAQDINNYGAFASKRERIKMYGQLLNRWFALNSAEFDSKPLGYIARKMTFGRKPTLVDISLDPNIRRMNANDKAALILGMSSAKDQALLNRY